MPFKAGDRVKYLDEKGGGVILKVIDDQYVEINDDDGFVFVRKMSELVAKGKSVTDEAELKRKLASALNHLEQNTKKASSQSRRDLLDKLQESKKHWTSKDRDFAEIDLHIEEITESPAFMSDGEKLILQLEYARTCLEEAISMRLPKIIFIHGVGAGVLKGEILKWLKTLPYVEVSPGRASRYGFGATEVRLGGKAFRQTI